MDPFAVIAAATGIVGAVVAVVALVYSRHRDKQEALTRGRLEAPLVTADQVAVLWDGNADRGSIARGVTAELRNQGQGVARDVGFEARLYLVTGLEFTVPPDDEVAAQFTHHVGALGVGATAAITALPSGLALQHDTIPRFDPDAVPVITTTVKFTDALGKAYLERNAMAGTPQGYEAGAYDHIPPPE